MRQANGLRSLVLLLVASASVAFADSDSLRKARELYERQEYVSSQETLLRVNRSELSDADKAEYDRLSAALPPAIQGSARAAQDLGDADRAYENASWDQAEALYLSVTNNPYATPTQVQHARAQVERVEEKRRLAEAARPQGPVEPTPMEPLPDPEPRTESPREQFDRPAQAQEPGALPPRTTMVDQLRWRDELLWQRAEAKMRDAARRSREALAANRFDEARSLADQALQEIEAARAYAEPASKYESARAFALALRQEVADTIDRESARMTEEQQRTISAQIEDARARHERLRREKIAQLLQTAQQLRKEGRFSEAAETVRQVLSLDSTHPEGRLMLEMYEDFAALQSQKDLDDTVRRQTRGALTEAREAITPWHDDVLYPKNWPEITARRLPQGLYGPGPDGELNRLLDKHRLPEFRFEQAPLGRVLESLAEAAHVNMNVDWDDLNANGIDRDYPISIRLRDVSARTAMRQVLAQLGGQATPDFLVNDGVIRIATRAKLSREKISVVHDIHDLLTAVPRFVSHEFDLTNSLAASDRSAGDRPALSDPQRLEEPLPDHGPSTSPMAAFIMNTIRETINPDSWRNPDDPKDGRDGAMRELNGQLIVYNTSDAQQKVSGLLDQLRRTASLQIAVESRFLIVTNNFLEEIGVDLDFVLNQSNAGFDPAFNANGGVRDNFTGAQVLIPRQFSRIGSVAATPGVGTPIPQGGVFQPYGIAGAVPAQSGGPGWSDMSPVPIQSGSINLINPTNINTGVPGSIAPDVITPALSIAGSFLDNIQVDFLIRATQANRRSSIVQAPRLLMFNGQRAFVAIQRTRQYVSSLTPAVAEGAVGVTPVTQFIASGTVLDVEGTISHDRRYVTLTVRTTLSEEPTFTRFEIQRQSGNSPGLFILLPDQQIRQINTTVSVPDGGTVLLGGLKQVGEVEQDAGVPVLSKIPVLKRAFTNTVTVKDTQTLLILLKAKILIQEEAEEDVFPGLTAAGT